LSRDKARRAARREAAKKAARCTMHVEPATCHALTGLSVHA